jgi:HAD superfamily hydrolase (TIGR01549 family)
MATRAVIWDFDGTICDTYPAIARVVNTALARFGATTSLAYVIELASTSLDDCIRTLADENGISYGQLDAFFRESYQHIQLSDQPPFPGVVELCQQLTLAGVHQFIVTHRRRESLLRLLSTHALDSYFMHIITADDGFPRKPAPDALMYLLNTYAVAPADALVIGDRDVDVLAGQAAGVPTCLFRAAFPGVIPTHTIKEYADLADIVRGASMAKSDTTAGIYPTASEDDVRDAVERAGV